MGELRSEGDKMDRHPVLDIDRMPASVKPCPQRQPRPAPARSPTGSRTRSWHRRIAERADTTRSARHTGNVFAFLDADGTQVSELARRAQVTERVHGRARRTPSKRHRLRRTHPRPRRPPRQARPRDPARPRGLRDRARGDRRDRARPRSASASDGSTPPSDVTTTTPAPR